MFWCIISFFALIVFASIGGLSAEFVFVFFIISLILGVFFVITYLCGLAESLRRYLSPTYDTFMRLCKRFSLSIAKSVKAENINS